MFQAQQARRRVFSVRCVPYEDMQLTFEKQLIKTGAIWSDSYKSKYTVRDTTKVIGELECCNMKGIFWFLENKYVIKQKGDFFPTTKYFLFVADQENPVAEIKAWEGWTFFRPYVKLENGKKYTFRKLKHTNNGLFWKSNKEAYYKVSLKHNDEDVLEYEFTKIGVTQ